MQGTNGFSVHAQHREAMELLQQWKEDIARWRAEQQRVAMMLETVRPAWEEAQTALEDHARKIQQMEEHLRRHEATLREAGWPAHLVEDESLVSEHQSFQNAVKAADTAHKNMETFYLGVMAEVWELVKLTHPDAVVQETN